MAKLIIGIGSGRCGTLSLCRLLNRQEDIVVSHELRPLPDISAISVGEVVEKFQGIMDRSDRPFCGDIAFFHLWYLPTILERFESVKVILLKRHKDSTVNSFLNKIKEWPGTKPVNHWAGINREKFTDTEFDKCFPKYSSDDPAEGISRYYDSYYDLADIYLKKYPDKICQVQTETFFRDPEQINKIFDWIGISKENRFTGLIHDTNRRAKKR